MENYFMKIISNIFFLILALLFSSQSYAQSLNIGKCNGCTSSAKYSQAMNWASANIPNASNVKKLYHIIDFQNQNIVTYEVSRVARYVYHISPPGYVYQPMAIAVTTPSDVSAKTVELFNGIRNLKTSISDIVIPSHIIENAWEFSNCAYCANEVGDYIRANGQFDIFLTQLQGISRWLGITNDFLVDTYTVSLEDGGEIEIRLSLTETSVIVEVLRVKDADNNNVPLSATNLSGMQIMVRYNSPEVINHYLIKFGFILGDPDERGVVTIEECNRPGSPARPNIPSCN